MIRATLLKYDQDRQLWTKADVLDLEVVPRVGESLQVRRPGEGPGPATEKIRGYLVIGVIWDVAAYKSPMSNVEKSTQSVYLKVNPHSAFEV